MRQAIEACGGDPSTRCARRSSRTGWLEHELADVYAKASSGFQRGRRVQKKL